MKDLFKNGEEGKHPIRNVLAKVRSRKAAKTYTGQKIASESDCKRQKFE